jgi:branched-chain amino acid transport system permease protein
LSALSLLTSGIVAVMLVLGGAKRIYGAFLGAAVYIVVSDTASKIDPYYWLFFIGALLMLVVLFVEGGLMGLIDQAQSRVAVWRGRGKR